jgi:hypothetical protein
MTRLWAVSVVASVMGCATHASEPQRETASPVAPAVAPRASAVIPAPFAEHVTALRDRLREKGLAGLEIRVEEPFVVVGNGSPEAVVRASETVRWAADILEADFFDKRPTKILDVFLFGDASSYYRGVERLTGSEPTTPYGFFSPSEGGLFMNIATGGGTLVHEIVHPYVEADVPDAPPWLNEGLGSLFEQSAERDGHIVGLTNWRLAGLQKAIVHARVPTFEALTHLDATAFYADDSGVNYAASRYLLYYLQEHGTLRAFYRRYRESADQDPSGYATLVATLGVTDMAAFERDWQRYVTKLTFP